MNQVIGDKGTSCPWCGKQFSFGERDGKVYIICPNSNCLIVPYAIFDSKESAIKALKDRIY